MMTKPPEWRAIHGKTQISLEIHQVYAEYSLYAQRAVNAPASLIGKGGDKVSLLTIRSVAAQHSQSAGQILFVLFDSLRPINNLSVKQGRLFLG